MSAKSSYDRIASIYNIDMGQNMPFDDVAAYTELAHQAGPRVLEVGCGQGRVTIPLALSGFDVTGIDISFPMLRQLQNKIPKPLPNLGIYVMDARSLSFKRPFDLIIFPYSGVTYLTEESDHEAFFRCAGHSMSKDGLLLLDSFIPRKMAEHTRFQLDYVRSMDSGKVLKRWKRISCDVKPGVNRVERLYKIFDADGNLLETRETDELIRCYTPEQLKKLCLDRGFIPKEEWFDYVPGESRDRTQFYSLIVQKA